MNEEVSDDNLWETPSYIRAQFQPMYFSEANTPTLDSADSVTIATPDRVEFALPSSTRLTRWSQAEIDLLQELKKDESLTYERISRVFARHGFEKSVQSIQQRWTKVQRPGLLKGRMTFSEENRLVKIFSEANGNLKQVARQMPNRSIMQIKRKCQQLGLLTRVERPTARE